MAAKVCRIWSRGFARKAKVKDLDSLKAWTSYRDELKQLRSQFRKDWLLREKEKEEAVSAQAVREQRLEKVEEEKNLKANEIELARMEKNREIATQKIMEQEERTHREGTERRMLFDDLIHEKREKEVEKQKIESDDFVTPKNIDNAIAYALKNPVNYNFALKRNGHKLY